MTESDECETDPEVLRRLRNGEWSTITPDMVYPSREELIPKLTELGLWPIPEGRGNG